MLALVLASGCGSSTSHTSQDITLTPTTLRAERRYFDGAPPIIPHDPMPGDCTACHTREGRALPGLGIAPANPHAQTQGVSAACRQCHVFRDTEDLFAESRFAPLKQIIRASVRAYPGAPPIMPHPLFMREDCHACHAGLAARPEIAFDHPQRTNCLQCHLAQTTTASTFPSFDTTNSR